jgi:hypothetical protein
VELITGTGEGSSRYVISDIFPSQAEADAEKERIRNMHGDLLENYRFSGWLRQS